MNLVDIVKALAHENRLRILNLISKQDLCVCEIEHIMGINQSNASRHLNKLKQVDLIYGERSAQWIHYNVNKNILKKYPFLKNLIKDELKKLEIIRKDDQKLKNYNKSELSCSDLT